MTAAAAILFTLCSVPGFPGPESRADYTIDAFLNTDSHTIECSGEITFHNGAGFSVDTLWIHLYPNAYRDTSSAFARDLERSCSYNFRGSSGEDRGWIDLSQWTIGGEPADITVEGTLGWILLPEPLENGDSIQLAGDFTVKVPKFWSRMGRYRETYQITQWYPKMCVLDHEGWHLSEYHASGEFFSDFGDYTVSLDVPADFITAATGRISEESFSEDSTRRTDHWEALNVHDFAWSSSPCYTVDTHVFNYSGNGGTVRVHIVKLESNEDYWEGIPEVVDSTLAFYGERYMPYPYNDLWVVDPVLPGSGGMEYPQFVFASFGVPRSRFLELVTIHEVGHQWFYGIVANNEVEEAWLDEGMNSFSEIECMERIYGFRGNVSKTPEWLLSLSDRDLQTLSYASGVSVDNTPVISTATCAGDGSYSPGYTYYTKPSLFMSMLKSELGDSVFTAVMKTYFERFAFHHPRTEDFQVIVEEISGRSWADEFNFWLRGTGSADSRVTSIRLSEDSTRVYVSSSFPHAVNLPVVFLNGQDSLFTSVELSPEGTAEVAVPGRWTRAVADPYQMYPDSAPWNNAFPADIRLKPLMLPVPVPSHHSLWALPFPWHDGDSWRLNTAFLVTPLPAEAGGPYTAASHLSFPLGNSREAMLSVYFSWPGETGYGKTTLFSAGAYSGFGYSRIQAGFTRRMFGPTRSLGEETLKFSAELFSVNDPEEFPGEDLSKGGWLTASLCLGKARENFNWSFSCDVEAAVGVSSARELFGTIGITGEIEEHRVSFFTGETRLFAGLVSLETPTQNMIRAGGALFAENALLGSFLPPEGVFSPSEHFLISEGPSLPGYGYSGLIGNAGFSIQQKFIHKTVPVGVYAGTGWAGDVRSPGNSSLLADGGLFLETGFVKAYFPVWVSSPPDGESNWDFRWRISAGN